MVALFVSQIGLAQGTSERDRPFDADWRFFRGDVKGAEALGFDDSRWRKLDLPHDWSIEDLPPRSNKVAEFEAVAGEWRFQPGDDLRWKEKGFDDAAWKRVVLPEAWERHSQSREENVFGWYRRRLTIPVALRGKDLMLLLGRIDDADEVWINGTRVGGSGSFPPRFQSAWDAERRYLVPRGLIRGDGTDVVAVRVFDGQNDGGIYQAGVKSARIGPFDSLESEGADRTGHVLGGIGWYRKRFTVPERGRKVALRFDGVYMNSQVWINGRLLGDHPHGYTSFEFDLTPYLRPAGQGNVVAVKVRNEGKNSRWYSGSGIYRHVWLTVRQPLQVPTDGVFVTMPEVSATKAVLKIATEVHNGTSKTAGPRVRVRIVDRTGKAVAKSELLAAISPGSTRAVEQTVTVPRPKLWSSLSPNLYSAVVEVVSEGRLVDQTSVRFGIRKIEVDAKRGFRLNGVPMKLKGGCVHHDNGPLGAVAIDRAEERRVELLKASGFNAIRSSHNPPSTAFLEACDRLGMLVIDEVFDQWSEAKNGNREDYHRFFDRWAERDVASMVRRDRNHPSVMMWSVGNEIPEQFRAEATGQRLRKAVLAHDTTRPITQAISSDWSEVARSWSSRSDSAFGHLDVAGYNYLPREMEADHLRRPDRVMMTTESYPRDAFDYWSLVEKNPYVIGDFVWTAMDYLGESGIGHSVLSNEPDSFFMPWPWFNAWCGDLDLCGFKKAQSLYRDVLWRQRPLAMVVHAPIPAGLTERVSGWGWPNEVASWNWRGQEGKPLQVSVYARCERVRLELNGKTIGEKPVSDATKLTARFDVPYAPGVLRAVGIMGGKVVASTVLRSSGLAQRVRLRVDRPDIRASRNDLSFVTVEVVDEKGVLVSDAEVRLRFSVSGAGELAAHGNGKPNDPASFRKPIGKTFRGQGLVILRPKAGLRGAIRLRVEAEGLPASTVSVRVR